MPARYSNRKSYIPLESNPDIFNELLKSVGVSKGLSFVDVYSFDDPDLLAVTPRPALALVLVFPPDDNAERDKELDTQHNMSDEELKRVEEKFGLMWFKQSIYNACGLYAILHATANGEARSHVPDDSALGALFKAGSSLNRNDRITLLEDSKEVEHAHASVARKGHTTAPNSPDDEVDHHYIAFVKSSTHPNHVFEMDGDRGGPVDLGPILKEGDDLLSPSATDVIRTYFHKGSGDLRYGIMALVLE